MSENQVKAVLQRVSTWPHERQQELAELALEIEAEMSDSTYQASSDELAAIDKAVTGDVATEEEIEAAFATFRQA